MAFGSETEDCGLLPVAKEQENISGASTSSGRRKLQSIVKSTLQSEEPEAKPSKPHVCTYPGCKAAFSRPWRLEAHHSVHCGEAPFACNKAGCTKKYTSQSHLTRHQKSAHSGGLTPSKLIPCPFEGCKGKFKTNQNVKKHVKRSHVEKVCPICSYRYYRKLELKYHMQIHTGVYLFKCDDCDLTFFRKTEYNRHMRGHKFFMCTRLDCDEAFDKWSLMRKHLVSHKPLYICYYCGKPSNKKNSFTSHVLTHLPDHPTRFNALKRYDCYHCKASVSGKQSLRRHMQVIHLNPRSKVVKKPKKPRAPRKDRGKPKPFVVPESTRLAGVSCAVPLAKALVSAQEPLLETIEDIVEVIEEALID